MFAGLVASPRGVARTAKSLVRVLRGSIAVGSVAGIILLPFSLLFHALWALALVVHALVLLARLYMSYGVYEPWAQVYASTRPLLSTIGVTLSLIAALLLALRVTASIARRCKPNPWLVSLEALTIALYLSAGAGVALHAIMGLAASILVVLIMPHYARTSRLFERAMLKVR